METESGRRTLDLADFEDSDGTGVKVTESQERARIKVDSYNPFGSTIYLDRADTFGLADRLAEVGAGLPDADGTHTVGISVELASDSLTAFLAALAAGEPVDTDTDLTARALANLARYLPAGIRVNIRATYQSTLEATS
jgi:hypothetical protein